MKAIFYIVITIVQLIGVTWLVVHAWKMPAQEMPDESAAACMELVTEVTYYSWRGWQPIDPESWNNLLQIKGRDIWLGYDQGGFDVPEDIIPLFRFRGIGEENQAVELWIWWARSTPASLYWFPFPSVVPFADSNGDHYGIHPCGAYIVNFNDFLDWLGQNNGMD